MLRRFAGCLAGIALLPGVAGSAHASVVLANPHGATFSGRYVADPRVTNAATTCYDGGVNAGVNTCAVWFKTPTSYKHMCAANAATKATVGYWAPDGADLSKNIGVDLYWTGGGVLEGTVVYPGTPAAYTMHIQLVDVCGDMPTTIDGLLRTDAGTDLSLGSTTAPNYKFTGYVDGV